MPLKPPNDSTCPTCGGRGTVALFQLSDYMDCPDCKGTGVIQPWRFHWPAMPWLPKLRKAVWSWAKALAFATLFVGAVSAITLGSAIERNNRIALCTSMGGHFVGQPFTHDECWSSDGRRVFPEGF